MREKRGCLICLLSVIGIFTLASLWNSYTSRPAALYKRWFGDSVPSDVTVLDGVSRFALTESTRWLSFRTTQQRIDQIVAHLEMDTVTAPEGWQWQEGARGVNQEITIAGETYHTNWFAHGLSRFRDHLPEIQVYWKAHSSDRPLISGYALYFVPSTGQALYIFISI